MTRAVTGLACLVAGAVLGAGAMALVGRDDGGADTPPSEDGAAAPAEEVDRGGHVLVFLVDGVTEEQRRGIEAALDTHADVEDYEYWDAEASVAEARQILAGDPEMLARVDAGLPVPESYRLLLREPDLPRATVVRGDLQGLPGVRQVVIMSTVPGLGD